MSELKDQHLGKNSGKLDKYIFKQRYGKTFVQLATEAYNPTKSEKVIANRNLFSQVMLFSNFVNKSALIKSVWQKMRKLPGKSTNMKIFKMNHNVIKNYGISSRCQILPENLHFKKAGIGLDEDFLSFSFTVYNTGIFDGAYNDFNPPFVFVAIIHMENPVNKSAEHKDTNLRIEEKVNTGKISLDGTTHFTFNTKKKTFEMINEYETVIVFPAIVCLDSYNQPYKWAGCGGIYFKGADPAIFPKQVKLPVAEPSVVIDIERR